LASLGSEFGEESVRRIIESTGISQVRVAPEGVCASDLCQAAAEHLFRGFRISPTSVDAIVFVSQTPDWRLPATSPSLQQRLGLRKDILAFDINYGCSGFVYGLLQAALLINAAECERVLVCVGDVTTRLVHPRDKALRFVFGDAGSAALVEPGPDTWSFSVGTDGAGASSLIVPAGGGRTPATEESATATEREDGNVRSDNDLYMNGMDIMQFSLREVPPAIDDVLDTAGWRHDEVGFYGLHQANQFILQYVAKKMKVPLEKVPIAMHRTGNVGPASIPLMLSMEHERLRAEGRLDRAVLCGFGVGFSWAAMTCSLSNTEFLAPIDVG
jgi:3-oxoacyl-[acyl-carrier-protein] synthase-3